MQAATNLTLNLILQPKPCIYGRVQLEKRNTKRNYDHQKLKKKKWERTKT